MVKVVTISNLGFAAVSLKSEGISAVGPFAMLNPVKTLQVLTTVNALSSPLSSAAPSAGWCDGRLQWSPVRPSLKNPLSTNHLRHHYCHHHCHRHCHS
jgi:hypothetical protein